MACAAAFGELKLKNVSAPEVLRVTICESTVGSLTSNEASATIISLARSPSPSRSPRK